MKKKISPKTVVTVIAVLMVLGGGIVLLHSPISPIQENSTHKIYMSPDRDPSLGKQTIDSQEKPPALRDSPELENQAQASPSIDSNSTSTGEPKITSQATEEMWEELSDELERQWLLDKLAEIGFDDPEQQEKLATWPLPVLRWQVENLSAKLDELTKSGAIKFVPPE